MTTDPQGGLDAAPDVDAETEAVALPSFPRRVVDVFVAPGRLGAALRDTPAWGAALVTGFVLAVVQTTLIPLDVWEEMARRTMMQRGTTVPAGTAIGGVTRAFAIGGAAIGYPLMMLIMAGVIALIFSFILGDEGRFKQYFSLLAHASLIPAFFGLLTVPMKIAEKDPRAVLSLGTFFTFLPEGYLHRVLSMLDLTQIWAWLVVAAGIHALNSKRSVTNAATILIGVNVVLVLIIAIFVHTT